MYEIRYAKSEFLLAMVEELLDEGKKVSLRVTGMSMYPFLREGKDTVLLKKGPYEAIKKRDIVLVRDQDGSYILHRLWKKSKNCFYLNGDGQRGVEGPFHPTTILGTVIGIWRDKQYISCCQFGWKLTSFIWYILFPLRMRVLRIYYRFGRPIVRWFKRRPSYEETM